MCVDVSKDRRRNILDARRKHPKSLKSTVAQCDMADMEAPEQKRKQPLEQGALPQDESVEAIIAAQKDCFRFIAKSWNNQEKKWIMK